MSETQSASGGPKPTWPSTTPAVDPAPSVVMPARSSSPMAASTSVTSPPPRRRDDAPDRLHEPARLDLPERLTVGPQPDRGGVPAIVGYRDELHSRSLLQQRSTLRLEFRALPENHHV